MDLGSHASGIGALAEPTRRRLYDYVVAQPGPVGREQTARELGLAQHTVSFHLDRLVEEGLLDVEYRRLTRRRGPGSGRPSKLYRRAEQEIAVSLPPRRYDLVGDILAAAVTRALSGMELAESVSDAARRAGVEVGEESAREGGPGTGAGPLRALAAALEPLGYEPRPVGIDGARRGGDGEVESGGSEDGEVGKEGDDGGDGRDGAMLLANCPYHSLAQDHTQLVCGLNQHFVQGVADGLGCEGLQACLEPGAGRCCVVVRRGPDVPESAVPH